MNECAVVSIIVPIYRVEMYLSECIDSLLGQTYKSIEIILIDDNSPDSCGEICDTYARKDGRIKVIHKQNGGAASARNVGLDVASGEYICFVDSDDVVLPNYIQELLKHLTDAHADISVCGYFDFDKKKKTKFLETEIPGVYDEKQYLAQFLKHWTCSLLWNKMYKKSVIDTIRMEEGHLIDDEFFTYQVVLNAKRVVVFDDPLYMYRLRASSVMRNVDSYKSKILMDRLEYMQIRYNHIIEKAPELKSAFFADLLDSYTRYWTGCQMFPNAQKNIRNWANNNIINIITCPEMTLKQRVDCLFKIRFCPAGKNDLFVEKKACIEDLFL